MIIHIILDYFCDSQKQMSFVDQGISYVFARFYLTDAFKEVLLTDKGRIILSFAKN